MGVGRAAADALEAAEVERKLMQIKPPGWNDTAGSGGVEQREQTTLDQNRGRRGCMRQAGQLTPQADNGSSRVTASTFSPNHHTACPTASAFLPRGRCLPRANHAWLSLPTLLARLAQ